VVGSLVVPGVAGVDWMVPVLGCGVLPDCTGLGVGCGTGLGVLSPGVGVGAFGVGCGTGLGVLSPGVGDGAFGVGAFGVVGGGPGLGVGRSAGLAVTGMSGFGSCSGSSLLGGDVFLYCKRRKSTLSGDVVILKGMT